MNRLIFWVWLTLDAFIEEGKCLFTVLWYTSNTIFIDDVLFLSLLFYVKQAQRKSEFHGTIY